MDSLLDYVTCELLHKGKNSQVKLGKQRNLFSYYTVQRLLDCDLCDLQNKSDVVERGMCVLIT